LKVYFRRLGEQPLIRIVRQTEVNPFFNRSFSLETRLEKERRLSTFPRCATAVSSQRVHPDFWRKKTLPYASLRNQSFLNGGPVSDSKTIQILFVYPVCHAAIWTTRLKYILAVTGPSMWPDYT